MSCSAFNKRVATALGVPWSELAARLVVVPTLGAAAMPARELHLPPESQAVELAVTPSLTACALLGKHATHATVLTLKPSKDLGKMLLAELPVVTSPCFGRSRAARTPFQPANQYWKLLLRAACIGHAHGRVSLVPSAKKLKTQLAACMAGSPAQLLKDVFGLNTTQHPSGAVAVEITDLLNSALRGLVARRQIILDKGTTLLSIQQITEALGDETVLGLLSTQWCERMQEVLAEPGWPRLRSADRAEVTLLISQAERSVRSQHQKYTSDADMPPCIRAALKQPKIGNDVRFAIGSVASEYAMLVGRPAADRQIGPIATVIRAVGGARRAKHFEYHASRTIAARRCCTMVDPRFGLACVHSSPHACLAERGMVRTRSSARSTRAARTRARALTTACAQAVSADQVTPSRVWASALSKRKREQPPVL